MVGKQAPIEGRARTCMGVEQLTALRAADLLGKADVLRLDALGAALP
jgi:hypothetical protein